MLVMNQDDMVTKCHLSSNKTVMLRACISDSCLSLLSVFLVFKIAASKAALVQQDSLTAATLIRNPCSVIT